MIAITPKGVRPWCTEADQALPREQRTYFLIEDMDERTRVAVNDAVAITPDPVTGQFSHGIGSRVYLTLKGCLKGIAEGSKLLDEEGGEVRFETDASGQVSDDFLGRLRWSDQQEMYVAIVQSASLEEDEKEG